MSELELIPEHNPRKQILAISQNRTEELAAFSPTNHVKDLSNEVDSLELEVIRLMKMYEA